MANGMAVFFFSLIALCAAYSPQPAQHATRKFVKHCTSKAEVGLCKAKLPRWWFNTESGKCETFYYGGCGGNKNRYLSKEQCEKTCALPIDKRCKSKYKSLHNDSRKSSYVFDSSTKQCRRGRGPFLNQRECAYTCRSVAVCTQPRPSVLCAGNAFPVYYYSPITGKCHSDLGCSYKGNNFPTLVECRRTCKAGK
uniref:BPTI/Kunitz inhibitor domain-containing protein n=1 Tax=Amblyomma cajennense TaxID=34607 RepID=A0A023FPG5_AMBCJ